MSPSYVSAVDVMSAWQDDLRSGKPPTLYPVADPGSPLADMEIGPGLVTLFGGPPGAGKTALIMQLVVDVLRLTPNLKALVANVEMSPSALLDRQFARLSGIDLHTVRHRKLHTEHTQRIDTGIATLASITSRLAFARSPWTVDNVARSADAVEADLIVMDYAQRFTPPGEHANKKTAVDAVMEYVRGMADCGVAVLVVAAVGRQRDDKGRSGYGGLSLASFRESSELEYGADDAFLLVPENADRPGAITLKHAKSRHGEPKDIPLRFTGSVQRFDAVHNRPVKGKLTTAVSDLWTDSRDTQEGQR